METKEVITLDLVPPFVLILGLIYVIIYFWKRRWLYYYASKLDGPFSLPVIGSLYLFLGSKDKIFETIMIETYEKCHLIAKFWLGPVLFIVVKRPEDLELLLKKNLEKSPVYEFVKKIGPGILSSPVEEWKVHRKLMNRTFSQNILNSYLGQFITRSKMLENELYQFCNTEIDILPKLSKCIFHTICDTLMGVDSSDLNQENQYMEWVSRSFKLVVKRLSPLYFFEIPWILSGNAQNLNCLYKNSQNHIKKIIDKKISSSSNGTNFLSYLIEMTKGQWKSKELIDEIHVMVTAGSDTTSITVAFCLLMIGMHQDVQKKIAEELESIFGNTNKEPTLEDLAQMNYLDRVIKETTRLFPVGPMIFRYVHEDVVLKNCTIPKGSNLLIPIISIHRNPEHWPDPIKFDPNRFLPDEVAKRPRYAFMPFSIPPRNCIGAKFAEMAMKVLLSTILRRFQVYSTQYDSIESIKLHYDVLLATRDGFGVTFAPK